jgi:integrase
MYDVVCRPKVRDGHVPIPAVFLAVGAFGHHVDLRGAVFQRDPRAAGTHALRADPVTTALFDRYRASRKKIHSVRTVYHESVVVKQWVKWCKQRGLLANNPLEDCRFEKPAIDPKGGPNLEQVDAILAAATESRCPLFAMLAFTGMRVGEERNLLCADVDLDENWIQIVSREGAETKTRESRKVPIHPRLKTMLAAIPKSTGKWFFTAEPSMKFPEGGHWISTKRINEDFEKTLRRLKIPAGRKEGGFTIHSLRHFFKTFCINAGIPKPVVDTWQGHHGDRSVSTQYYKLADEDSQKFMLKVPFGTGKPAADAGNT